MAAMLIAALCTSVAVGARSVPGGGISARDSSGCAARVSARVLPTWARAGFSDPKARMPYTVSAHASIAAILFAEPLLSPPPKDHNNKILWVSRAPDSTRSDLRISAQRIKDSRPVGRAVTRIVSRGPGPSIINMPQAGCYRFNLSWSGHTDWLNLNYAANR